MWRVGAFCFALCGLGLLALAVVHVSRPVLASGPSSNRVLNYQLRLTDASGVPLTGTQNIKISFYSAATGGTRLHTDCGTTLTPVARKVVFSTGMGTVIIGDTAADAAHNCSDGSAPNAIPADLFSNTALYLGITIAADAEMSPRKRITAAGYALNADRLDDLDSSAAGGTAAFVPVTDPAGRLTLTGSPTGAIAVLTLDPPAAAATDLLIDLQDAGTSRLQVNARGDVAADTNTFVIDATNNRVGIGEAAPAATLVVGANLFQVAGASGDVTTVGDVAVNGGVLSTTAALFDLLNTAATTVNFAGAATTLSVGAASGTTTINHSLNVKGDAFLGDAASDSIAANGRFTTSLIPSSDNSVSLGTSADRWAGLHLGPASLVVHNDATDTDKATLGFSGSTAQLVTNSATPLQLATGTNAGVYVDTAGNIGAGTTTPGRSLDVIGNWGGNAFSDAEALTSNSTVTVSTKALTYNLSNNSGTTDASITTTFNITGLPDTDGTFAFVQLRAQKGVTAGTRVQTVDLQVNSVAVTSVGTANTNNASMLSKNFTLVRIGGVWTVVGAAGDGTGTSSAGSFAATETTNLINSTTTPMNTSLSFSMGANETWSAFFTLRSFNAVNASDVTYDLTVPAGATCYLSSGTFKNGTSVDTTSCTGAITPTVGTVDELVILQFTVINGPTEGAVTLRFASTTAGNAAHVDAGSHMAAFIDQGADLAERYFAADPDVMPGSVVSIDRSLAAGVARSERPYDPDVIGVVSTAPGMVLGDRDIPEGARPVYLALAGRVPVRVSDENGPIGIGDFLTASSTPGVAMRASSVGMVIGRALDPFSGPGPGAVRVLVGVGWRDARETNGPLADATPAPLDAYGRSGLGAGGALGPAGPWSLDGDGRLIVGDVVADSVSVRINEARRTMDKGLIPAGSAAAVVANPGIRENSEIFVTFKKNPGSSWWIDDTREGSFVLRTERPVAEDTFFSYWIVGVVDETAPLSP